MIETTTLFFKNSKKDIFQLLLALVLIALINFIFFQTAVYSKIFLPDSAAGQVMLMVNAEKTRKLPEPDFKTAIIFGDSRLAEGFSAKLANLEARSKRLEIVNSAIPSTTPRCWYYFTKKLDPDLKKYSYIVLGIPSLSRLSSDDLEERMLDLDYLSPIADIRDYTEIANSYHNFESKINAFRFLLLKGFVYKYDVQDFLSRPKERMKVILNPYISEGWSHNYEYDGRQETLSGVTWDLATRKAIYPEGYSAEKKEFVQKFINSLDESPQQRNLNYHTFWLEKMLVRYQHTNTKVIVFQVPAGPLQITTEKDEVFEDIKRLSTSYANLIILPAPQFRQLETPELFFDYLHLNQNGRKQLTKDLTQILIEKHQQSSTN